MNVLEETFNIKNLETKIKAYEKYKCNENELGWKIKNFISAIFCFDSEYKHVTCNNVENGHYAICCWSDAACREGPDTCICTQLKLRAFYIQTAYRECIDEISTLESL